MRDEDFWTSFEHDLEAQDGPPDRERPETLAAYCVAFVLIVVALFAWCAVRWWHQ